MGSDEPSPLPSALPAAQATDVTRPTTPMDDAIAATRAHMERVERKPMLARPRRSFRAVLAEVQRERAAAQEAAQ